MADVRFSAIHKKVLLLLHLIELRQGLGVAVHSSFLRKRVSAILSEEKHYDVVIKQPNMSVSLKALVERGYLWGAVNTDFMYSRQAKATENVFGLTPLGRQYAESTYANMVRMNHYRRK